MNHSIDVLLRTVSDLRLKLKSRIPLVRYKALQHENKVLRSELLIYQKEITSLLSQLESKIRAKK